MTNQPATSRLYVGNYTRLAPYARGHADGVGVYQLVDSNGTSNGALALLQTATDAFNPTYVALSPSGKNLYAVNAVSEIDGHPGGGVSAYAVDPATGQLTFLNRESSGGDGPCHVTVEKTGRFLVVTNYRGGNLAMLPILDGGRLGPATDFIQHVGSSVNKSRQSEPHTHSANVDPSNRFVYVCDLGLDQIVVYEMDLTHGRLRRDEKRIVRARPGCGPRHLSFHPNLRWAYVINEIDSTISLYDYDPTTGMLAERQHVSTLPAGWSGENTTAEVRVAPSGRFVYGSNRGHDSIAIYSVDQSTGELTLVGIEPSRGRTPRNFALTPDGALCLVANQDSDNIVAFRVDQSTGLLSATGVETASPSPVCLTFA
jgi:6-phosphogluconolactonase